jgi:hypothetical protein
MVNLLIQISLFKMRIKVFFFLFLFDGGGVALKLPGHRVKTQLLVEVIQGQSQRILETSIPDNNNDRRQKV